MGILRGLYCNSLKSSQVATNLIRAATVREGTRAEEILVAAMLLCGAGCQPAAGWQPARKHLKTDMDGAG
jgi:hypothetical protein